MTTQVFENKVLNELRDIKHTILKLKHEVEELKEPTEKVSEEYINKIKAVLREGRFKRYKTISDVKKRFRVA